MNASKDGTDGTGCQSRNAEGCESQGLLEAAHTIPVRAPATSQYRQRLQYAVVLVGLVAVLSASVSFTVRRSLRTASSFPERFLSDNGTTIYEPMIFNLNKTGESCANIDKIGVLGFNVSSDVECSVWCQSLVNCVQFIYSPEYLDDRGSSNCRVLMDWCDLKPAPGWNLYDGAGGKIMNNGLVFGFDAHWTMEGSQQWVFQGGNLGCPRDTFRCPASGVEELVVAGPPPRERWEAVFNFIVAGRRQPGDYRPSYICEDASRPLVFATARINPFGFGSRMNNFANEVLWAMWAGAPLVLCARAGAHDSWPTYFDPVDFARCSDCGDAPSVFASGSCAGAFASRSLDEASVGDLKRFVYSKVFRFNSRVMERRSALLESLAITGAPYVGVHMRRGDKINETLAGQPGRYIGVEVFAKEVRKQCHALGRQACAVYVASDWSAARGELQEQLPEMVVVSQGRLSPELYKVRNDDWEDEAAKDAEEASFVLDLSMLTHASVFIGTATSNVGRFVYFLRPGNATSISLDCGGSFLMLNC